MGQPAVFLDRDGTINVEKDYVYLWKDWEWLPGAVEALKHLKDMGYLLVVVSNQSGVARGYYREEDIHRLHEKVNQELLKHNVQIDAFYYCPHHAKYGDKKECSCRKPNPGLLLRAQKDLGIDLKHSYMIGDKVVDVEAGLSAGAESILVETGYGQKQKNILKHSVSVVRDLLSAVDIIRAKSF